LKFFYDVIDKVDKAVGSMYLIMEQKVYGSVGKAIVEVLVNK
jgi:hypothetical protein